MTTEERLARIEAHLFGKPEQPQEQPKPKFGSFYVDCTRDEYPEVKAILEAQGYELYGTEWLHGEHCVSVNKDGKYFTYEMQYHDNFKPTLTLAQLREKYGEQPKTKTRIEWLQELPDGYRERALANCVEWKDGKLSDECGSMEDAIWNMCGWLDTSEGGHFWFAVFEHYHNGTTLPPLPDEPKKYEAGFWFNNVTNLNLPDGGHLFLGIGSGVWQKYFRIFPRSAQPHTLKPVEQHTVGMFYAIAGASGEHLNDYRNYALCVGEGEFVGAYPYSPNVVTIHGYGTSNISLLEVTPA